MTTHMDYEIVNPDPAGTVASLSSLGYTVEAAVADLVDNSVSAGARCIRVVFTWQGAASWAAVVDEGRGMDPAELLIAMTVAAKGVSACRTPDDLGRFGMGLKTASFSQARQLTVHTRAAGHDALTRSWDLDAVVESGEWRLLNGTDEDTEHVLTALLPDGRHGTVVVWRRLHRYHNADGGDRTAAQKSFYAEAERVARHLGMVFGRFLTGRDRVEILVNGLAVAPWDPFMSGHPSVLRLPPEEIPVGEHAVRVEPFVLPHPRRLAEDERELAAGPAGWLDQQGFYVYRRRRLILAGDWLGIRGFRRDERYNLARIAVDVPAEADADWRIDVRKSSAVPPVGVRRHLERIGHATRARAAEVLNHRSGVNARAYGADFIYAWKVDRRTGRIRCTINREHPLVRRVIRGASADQADTKALLRLLEETVPVATMRTMHQADTADDPEPFGDAAPDEVTNVAQRIYEALTAEGRPPAEAKRRLSQMPPFNEFEGFWTGSS
jgi:hypothetical protein